MIRLMRRGRDGHHADLPGPDDYLPFTTAGLRAVSRVTVAAIERLESLRPGDPWLPWADVPHVLYRERSRCPGSRGQAQKRRAEAG